MYSHALLLRTLILMFVWPALYVGATSQGHSWREWYFLRAKSHLFNPTLSGTCSEGQTWDEKLNHPTENQKLRHLPRAQRLLACWLIFVLLWIWVREIEYWGHRQVVGNVWVAQNWPWQYALARTKERGVIEVADHGLWTCETWCSIWSVHFSEVSP